MRTLLFIALILLGKAGFAQPYFSDTTTNGSPASTYRGMVVENDSIFYLLGMFTEFNPNLNVRLLVSKRNNQQITQNWLRGRSGIYYFMSDMKKFGEYLYITGSIPGNSPWASQSLYNTYLLVLNGQGDSILYKEFDSGQPDVTFSGRSITVVSNEIWISASWGKLTANSIIDNKICLLRLDSTGHEKGRYMYGSTAPGFSQISGSIETNAQNEIIVSAENCINCLSNSIPQIQAWVFAIDTSGNILRQYNTPFSQNISWCTANPVSDGGIIFSGNRNRYIPNVNGSYSSRSLGYVAKLDSLLQPQWSVTFGDESPSTSLFEVIQDQSGGYIAVGKIIDSVNINPSIGWLTKINSQGQVLWHRKFMPFPSLQSQQLGSLEHVAVTELGNIVAAGHGISLQGGLPHAQYAWIIKTDSMGCLVPGCAVSLRELTTEPVYLKAWPNPVSEVLNVLVKSEKPLHGAHFNLIDMIGRTQRQWEGSYEELQYQIAVHDLPAGLYVLQLEKNGQLLAREKVVVAR